MGSVTSPSMDLDRDAKRFRDYAVGLLGADKGGQLASLVGELSGALTTP